MSIKKKLIVCLATLITFSAAVVLAAVYAALMFSDRFGKPKTQDLYVDRLLMYFLAVAAIVFILMMAAMAIIGFMLVRSVISPLNKIYRLAGEIKNGNLDCEVYYYKKDEFKKVFEEFDEMRLRLKDSLERLKQQEESRKDMVISIAHDIKTPVTAICGHAEGLIDGIADTPGKQEKYLRTILEKSRLVDKLVSDLFTFSKLDFNQMPFNLTTVNAAEYIKDVYSELPPGQFGVEFDITGGGEIAIDQFQFKRVLQNISQNSAKYANGSAVHIGVSIRDSNGNVIIKISDNGVGVSADECDKLFDRFFRADRSRGTAGSGLGLSISRQIIEAMDGKIWARPNEPSGLSVYISLPKKA